MIVRVLTAALLVALATPAFALPCAEAPRSDADALEQAARCRWRYGDPDRAKEHTRALRKLGGPSADRARYLSALESLRHGKARKAIKTLSTVARRHPTWLGVRGSARSRTTSSEAPSPALIMARWAMSPRFLLWRARARAAMACSPPSLARVRANFCR